ncbi:MAG: TIGR02266 family protein [Deltaproteobacteria bacterium]|nr:TIGR02266 family protein [Deltaproteobacteria bacterium]
MARQVTHTDRRRSRREGAEISVQYESVDELFSEFTRDINEGGVFIATERPLDLDEPVSLSFQLPGGERAIRVSGRVVRVQTKDDDGVAGMAVEFEALDATARRAIDDLVRSLRR